MATYNILIKGKLNTCKYFSLIRCIYCFGKQGASIDSTDAKWAIEKAKWQNLPFSSPPHGQLSKFTCSAVSGARCLAALRSLL
ncbi:hypothetical protein FKM82_008035 [Ascaphus truei]